MKENELRIGNFFTTLMPVGGSWYEKQRYDKNILIATKQTFWQWDENNFTGIPLTEEWLLKFGFEKDNEDKDKFWIIKDWKIYYSVFNKGIRFIDSGWIVDFQYVHQLQNLYFALTGEELTLNSQPIKK